MKPGYLTTEFLISVALLVAATFLLAIGTIDQETWKWAVTTAVGAYSISRGLAKINPPKEETTDTFAVGKPPFAANDRAIDAPPPVPPAPRRR